MYILENNTKGLWIGKNTELSTEFYFSHYKEITRNLENLSIKFSNRYNCRWMKDDLYEVAMKKIINHGEIEKNLCFNEEKLLGKLFYIAKYAMLNQIIVNFKNINYSDSLNLSINNLCENMECEEFIEEDSIYEWIKEIEFNIMQKSIILEMIRQRYNIIENRTKSLRIISKKLKITNEELYHEIDNLQKIFINLAKVRVCKNGEVIINGE